jgi:hypothetical protein
MNRRVSSGYRKRERLNVVKIVAVLALTVAIGYYGFLGVKCYRHFEELKRGVVTTISIGGGVR